MKRNTLIDFKFLEDIMRYDGSLLSLGISQDDEYVFVVWCDVNYEKQFNIYSYIFFSDKDVLLYHKNKVNHLPEKVNKLGKLKLNNSLLFNKINKIQY